MNILLSAAKDNQSVFKNLVISTISDFESFLQNGEYLSAHRQTGDCGVELDKFAAADILLVKIRLPAAGIKAALECQFTSQHSLFSATNGHEALIGFKTLKSIDDAKTYVRLLAGLETIYAGAIPHGSALQAFGLDGKLSFTANKQTLPREAYERIDRLGAETKQIRKGGTGYVRSHITVDRSTIVKIAAGESAALEQLPKDIQVFCPVHVDARPTAVVHWFGDGTPGIQCSHCQRTYAAQSTNRVYDFRKFDDIIKSISLESEKTTSNDLTVTSDKDIVYLNEKYLPDISITEGVTIVKSPKGTGKTEALVKLISSCKKSKMRVLLIGHRRALIQAMANRLDIDAYFIMENKSGSLKKTSREPLLNFGDESTPLPKVIELEEESHADEIAPYMRVTPTKHYAISLDSLTELQPDENKYDLVIIDESEQVFSHLIGGTLKQRRRGVHARLSHYLRVAKHVVVMDADMNQITVDALHAACRGDTPVNIIINEPQSNNGTVWMHQSKGQLVSEIIDHTLRNKKIYVATNSKKKAEELAFVLREKFPDKRVVVITSDNSQHESTQKILANITHEYKGTLDVLIASPAIGTGIDITFKNASGEGTTVVHSVFGLFEGNIVTHFDIDQQLMRVRHPVSVHVWIDQRPLNYEVDTDCIRRELDQTVRKTEYLIKFDDGGKPIYSGDEGLLAIYARVLASQRGSKNNLSRLFRELRHQNGWQVEDIEFDDVEENAGKEALVKAKELRLVEREINLISAIQLDKDEANRLAEKNGKGIALNKAERYALERYQIESFYAQGDITSDVIAFDNEGGTRPSVLRLECLVCDTAWYADRDSKEMHDNVVTFDRSSYLVQRQLLEKLVTATGVFDPSTRNFDVTIEFHKTSLANFIDIINSNSNQFEAIFGLPLNTDRHKNPIAQLKTVFSMIGLSIAAGKVSQSNGKKIRHYAIDSNSLNEMLRVIKNRDRKLGR